MNQEALANKYRPKKMSDVVGQEVVTTVLENSIKRGELHHCYIFGGNFGSGKTSCARLFAACVNNPSGPTLEPDINDPLIKSIFDGKCLDVKEIDAASQRGIDDIKSLKESLCYAPMECKYKFVILDEMHRLTGAAVEAALKMIEEPPKGVIFILCTTEVNKLKDTIRSRAIQLKFNKIAWNVIFNQLKKISDLEKIEIDDISLKLVARTSQQSMRNALQNLQLLVTYSGGKPINKEIAEKALGSLDESHYFKLIDAILKPDAGEAMRVIDQLLGDGRDIGDVLNGLVDHIRNLLIMKTYPETSGLICLTEAERKRFEIQKSKIHLQLIIRMVELIGEINRAIAVNISPQLAMEVFVVKSIIENATLKANTTNNAQVQEKKVKVSA